MTLKLLSPKIIRKNGKRFDLILDSKIVSSLILNPTEFESELEKCYNWPKFNHLLTLSAFGADLTQN